MNTKQEDTSPYWLRSASLPQFAKLAEDTRADVVVVGGGPTGLTVAYLLASANKSVNVLERGRCVLTDTGHSHCGVPANQRRSSIIRATIQPRVGPPASPFAHR